MPNTAFQLFTLSTATCSNTEMSNPEGRIVSTLQRGTYPLSTEGAKDGRYDRILIDWGTFIYNFGKGSALKNSLQTSIGKTIRCQPQWGIDVDILISLSLMMVRLQYPATLKMELHQWKA